MKFFWFFKVNPLKRKHENDDNEEHSDSDTSSVNTQASLISMASNTNESAEEMIENSGNIDLPPDIELNPMQESEAEDVCEMLATFDCSNIVNMSLVYCIETGSLIILSCFVYLAFSICHKLKMYLLIFLTAPVERRTGQVLTWRWKQGKKRDGKE